MIPHQSALYLAANLLLFALLLLYWAYVFRPRWITERMLLAALLSFSTCQGTALLWSTVRLGPWAIAHSYVSTMFLIEAIVLVYLLLERLSSQRGQGAYVLILGFVIHTCVILFVPPPIEATLQISPFVRSPWYLLHLLCALVAYGAYMCAGVGAIGYFVTRLLTRTRLAAHLPSSQDCQMLTRRALVIGFPWLSGSLMMGALWSQLAWGNYWSWRPEEIWLLIVWLILSLTLHARTMARWQGRPLALLSFLGFILTMLSLPVLARGLPPAW